MKAFFALMRREFIEHRVSFLYAPLVILGLITLLVLSGAITGHVDATIAGVVPAVPKFYELLYGVALGAWWLYLIAALAFYCSDAFSADRRDNAMLFWKSMPQGDTKVLWSKMMAALLMFPALMLVTMLLSGLVSIGFAVWASGGVLTPGELASRFLNMSGVAAAYLVISLLWYAPFFAWVGGLSAVFGRWSIPLAFLIPGLIGLIEEVYRRSSTVLGYLETRSHLDFGGIDATRLLLLTPEVRADQMVPFMVGNTDWLAVATGLAFTVLAMTLAGQYRRRVLR